MNNKKQRSLAVLAGSFSVLLGFSGASLAQEDDTKSPFSFSASQSFYRDDNMYRLPKHVPDYAIPKGKRSDTYSVTNVGVNFDKEYSRQAIHAGLSVGRTIYRTHSSLNNTSPDAHLRWDWRVGDRWSGVLGYSYNEAFVGFSDSYSYNPGTGMYNFNQDRVVRRLARANVSADYWWHPDWAVGGSFSDVRNSYRNNLRPYDKYDAQTGSLNLTYRPSTGNRLVLSLRAEEGQYPNRAKKSELAAFGPGSESLRDWSQRDLRLSGQWQLTGVSQLSGYVGYTQREYDLASSRDFSGVTGRLAFRWTPSGKAIVDLSWRREVGADMDAISNYAVTQGWSLQPTWIVTSKVRLGASLEYLNRSYGGNPNFYGSSLENVPRRDARTTSYGLNAQYLPTASTSIVLGYQNEKRDAKESYYDYRARIVWLSGSLTF